LNDCSAGLVMIPVKVFSNARKAYDPILIFVWLLDIMCNKQY